MIKTKPIVTLVFIAIIFLILLIGYPLLKQDKKQMDLQSGDVGCVLVRKNSTSVIIEDRAEIEEIIALVNKMEYRQEHPSVAIRYRQKQKQQKDILYCFF